MKLQIKYTDDIEFAEAQLWSALHKIRQNKKPTPIDNLSLEEAETFSKSLRRTEDSYEAQELDNGKFRLYHKANWVTNSADVKVWSFIGAAIIFDRFDELEAYMTVHDIKGVALSKGSNHGK